MMFDKLFDLRMEPGERIQIGANEWLVGNKYGRPVLTGVTMVTYPFWRNIESLSDRQSEESGDPKDRKQDS